LKNRPQFSLGFTLIELLVVVGVTLVLAVTLVPVRAKSHPRSSAFQCLNNNRQLCVAWRSYAEDNQDRLVYSSDDGSTFNNPSNQYAWTTSHMDSDPGNRGNWDTNYDIVNRPLWPYTGRNASIYRCPSDKSVVFVNGVARPRVRSMSMNLYLGGFAGTDGGWPQVQPFCIYTKLTEINGGLPTPGPAKLFVFLDMREDCINWGDFMTDMTGYPNNPAAYSFADFPGMYHQRAASFTFADGHGEIHQWRDLRTTPPLNPFSPPTSTASPRNPDIAWLQDHSTRPK
jgi:prepilin-type processing-associated H-X9-DG protein